MTTERGDAFQVVLPFGTVDALLAAGSSSFISWLSPAFHEQELIKWTSSAGYFL